MLHPHLTRPRGTGPITRGGSYIPNISRNSKTPAFRALHARLARARRTPWLLAAFLGVVAFALVLAGTEPPGPGLDPDTAFYLGGATSLAAGTGFRAPIAPWASRDSTAPIGHFPPGFSAAIAVPTALGMPPAQAARLVNALAAFVTVATAAYLAALAAGPLIALLLGAALLVTPALVYVHLDLLSEPLFLACVSLALLAMIRAPRRPLLAGLAAAAAALVRYAGVAVTGAAILWAFGQRGALRVRVRRAVLAALPTVVLQAAWVAHARAVGGKKAVRQIAIYVANFGRDLSMAWQTTTEWLVPHSDQDVHIHAPLVAIAALALIAIIIAAGGRAAWRAWRATRDRAAGDPAYRRAHSAAATLAACGVFAVCYVGVLVLSRLFADPFIPFDERLLSPLMLVLELAAAVSIGAWWSAGADLSRIALLVAAAIWWGAALGVDGDVVNWALTNGNDFAGEDWRRSELLYWARTHAGRAPLYANWPAAVNFQLHRAAWQLPLVDAPVSWSAFADTIRARRALILDFDVQNPEFVRQDTLDRIPGLVLVRRLADGKVIAAAGTAPAAR